MARTQNTLIGRTSGSIGGVTFSTWKGINVAKSKATSVADPKTPAQLAQRAKMANAVILFKALGSIANTGFVEGATGKSAYNVFVSTNIKNGAIAAEPNNGLGNPAAFTISSGTLENTEITSATADSDAKTVVVNWAPALSGNKLATDKASVVVINSLGRIIGKSINDAERSDGSIAVALDEVLTVGTQANVYLGFYQSGSRKSSDSVYIAPTVTA
jgi:hypothetical protein